MAELHVQPKRPNLWWLWLLLALIIAGAAYYWYTNYYHKSAGGTTTVTDSTTTTTDTTKTAVDTTGPDWSSVNFNSPKTTDENITDKDIATSGNTTYTIYSIGENILFASNQTTLQDNATGKLRQIAAALSKNFNGAHVGVYGSTDSTGTAGQNKQIGAQRAEAVKDWLIKNAGISEANVSVHSLGEAHPVASNASTNGRQQNRNVMIVAFKDSSANPQ